MAADRLGRPFRTIQGKVVLVFVLLTLLAMQLIGAYLLHSLQNYYLDDFQRQVQDRAQGLAKAVASELASPAAGGHAADIAALVDVFGEVSQFGIVVVDRQGVVEAALPPTGVGQRTAVPAVAQALASDRAVLTPARLDPATRRPYLAYALPVGQAGTEVGAVYVQGYLDQIYRTLAGVRRVLFEATLVVLAITVALSLFLARTITGPIKDLTRRAGELAAGNFDRLIEVRSGDELGRLGAMFNAMTVRLRTTLGEISAEKRKAEAILTNMTDGIVAFDSGGEVTLTNPAAERMLRVRPGASLPEALRPLLAGGPSGRIEVPERGLVFQAHTAPLAEGAVAVLHDVSDQERLESLRREFVADVSHELRTPITTIKSYVETLLDGALEDPEVGVRFLRVVADETNRMVRLVSDLLQLTQLDSRRAVGERRLIDVAQLAAGLGERFAERCSKKSIEFAVHAAAGLPRVRADADRITQVMTNLLTNAIDFTAPGGRVEVGVERGAGSVVVRVRDTGVGIPAADLPRVFDRFYRVDKARSREFGGTGLGLAIAKQIVEAHDGTIGIESEVGRGTEVRFSLPLGRDNST